RLAAAPVGVDVVQAGDDRLQVGLGDVLGRVDAEARHADGDQVVEVVRDPVADVGGGGPQVGQADQFAVLHLPLVVPVGDVAAAVVEVLALVEARVLVLAVGRPRAAGAGADGPGAAPVVDDRVDVDLDPGLAAGVDHVDEVGPGAAAGLVEPVGHRLVVLPPGVSLTGQHHVLLGRGDLHRAEAVGAQRGLALLG